MQKYQLIKIHLLINLQQASYNNNYNYLQLIYLFVFNSFLGCSLITVIESLTLVETEELKQAFFVFLAVTPIQQNTHIGKITGLKPIQHTASQHSSP